MLQLAQVVAINPAKHTAEIVLSNSGVRVADVMIMGSASSDGGSWSIPSVKRPTNERYAGGVPPTGRALVAVVAPASGRYIVVGFVRPPDGFGVGEQDRAIYSHPASGSYATMAPDGSIEAFHGPSGSCIRMGTGGHAAVPGVATPAGGGASPTVTLSTPQFSLVADPTGNVTLAAQADVDVTSQTNVNLTAPNIALSGVIALNGPVSQAAGSAGAGSNVTMEGPVTVTNDLIAQGKSVHNHQHTLVQPGGGTSGPPA